MKTYQTLYRDIYSFGNLVRAWKKAKKRKTKKWYVREFEQQLDRNLSGLQKELETHNYRPKPLETFILRDPKTRKISKSDFRDRIVHHALVRVIEPIFDKRFIYDCCANRKEKGPLFASQRLDLFKSKISKSGRRVTGKRKDKNHIKGYCLKADIRHYFETVDHGILLSIIQKKIDDEEVLWLIKQILDNFQTKNEGKGMPLGNLTSQFFANVYLNELDYFIKHQLRAKYYIRYVDDFVILHESKEQTVRWGGRLNSFLTKNSNFSFIQKKNNPFSERYRFPRFP